MNKMASVLKLNVGDEETALKLDEHVKTMTEMMREHEGFESTQREVCTEQWWYGLSFVFNNPESFDAWKTSQTRTKVHLFYQEALNDCGIPESA